MSHSSTSQSRSRSKLTSAALPPSDRSRTIASLPRRVNARELLDRLTTVKSKPTEAEIRRNLALLTNIARPLSPTLPLSPPISPKPLKRKSPDNDGDIGVEAVKRSKTSATSAGGAASPSSSSSLTSLDRTAFSSGGSDRSIAATGKETGGETDHRSSRNIPSGSRDPSSSSTPAVETPRRARVMMTPEKLNQIHYAYQEKAKTLKRSSEKRYTLAKNDEGRTYANIEHFDSVLLFAYGFWARGVAGSRDPTTWEGLLAYMTNVRAKWASRVRDSASFPPTKEYVTSKMVLGVLDMVRFCALSQLHRYYSQKLQATQMQGIASATSDHSSNSPPGSFQLTPPPPYTSASTGASSQGGQNGSARPNMGPSPASSSSSGHHQQRSTHTPPTAPSGAPANGNGNHGPNSVTQSPHQPANGGSPTGSVSVSVDVVTLLTKVLQTSSQMAEASGYGSLMTLHDLRKHFPVTYAVSVGDNTSTGKPLKPGVVEDAFQVDVLACVQGQGEWAWPITSGDDLAHVVGFGRSLCWEMGLDCTQQGYKGLDGAWKWEDGTSFQ